MPKQIVVVPYDPRWPDVFAQEKAAILGAIGPRLVAIEHVGSTSVPGLAAKPIVDVMAGVPSLAETARAYEQLKLDLAATTAGIAYGRGKTSFVQSVLAQAPGAQP